MKRRPSSMVALALMLTGCASDPSPRLYVLSPPVATRAETSVAAGQPILQLQPVLLPDYLDTTDILLRSGRNEITASATGRWGERLSQGLTHALAAALAVRLPQDRITLGASADRPARQILVDVDAFDVHPDGHCVLAARWTLLDKDGKTVASAGRGSFVATAAATSGGADDAAIVAAMAGAVDQLADRIGMAAEATPP